MRAVIIDDEKHSSESLRLLLERYCPQVEVLAEINKATDGWESIRKYQPDVVFLDIEMPELNGFELLEQLDQFEFEVIFTTAYNEFAVQAFKVRAADYLLKPVEPEELQSAVRHLSVKLKDEATGNVNFLKKAGKISLPTVDGIEFINAEEIIRCESDSNYTMIVLADTKKLVSKTLKEIHELLSDYPFVRVHHSHIINLRHMTKYTKGTGGSVTMSNGDEISVSRSRKQALLDLLE